MEIFKKEINKKRIELGKQCQSLSQKILVKELKNQQLHFILNDHIDIVSLIKNLIKDTKEKPKVRINNNSEVLNAIHGIKDSIDQLTIKVNSLETKVDSLETKVNRIETDVALIKSLPTIQKEIQELNKTKNKLN